MLKFLKQRGGVALDGLVGEIGNKSAHLSSFICIDRAPAPWFQSPLVFLASAASRAISSRVMPLVVRRSADTSTGAA
jgi:hypothetical protein